KLRLPSAREIGSAPGSSSRFWRWRRRFRLFQRGRYLHDVILEHQLCELMQASPPTQPFVSGAGRYVVVSVDTRFCEGFGVYLRISTERPAVGAWSAVGGVNFTAAVTDEHKLYLLFEGSQVGNIRQGNAAATEDADIGELIQVGQSDSPGLHAAHREACHGAVRLIGKGAVVGINKRNQVVKQNMLESAEIEPASTWA